MDFETVLITGDEEETFAFSYNLTSRGAFIARFLRDPKCLDSIPSRIVACFHQLEVDDPESQSFPNRAAMRDAIRREVSAIWPRFANNLAVYRQGATLDFGAHGQTGWVLCLNPIAHSRFLSYLKTFEDVCREIPVLALQKSAFYDDLVPTSLLGGRGNSMVVRIADKDDISGSQHFVFKGLTFLDSMDNEQFSQERNVFYHELQLLCSMPEHTNVKSRPLALVLANPTNDGMTTVDSQMTSSQSYVCGVLYNFSEHGSLESIICKAIEDKRRLSLSEKAKWCHNLSDALWHLHRVARTYHMDIKTANVLISTDTDNGGRKAVFIDFEQAGAAPWYIAPEIDGSFDVSEIQKGNTSWLVYTQYTGPPRINNWCDPKWNVFPIWRETCPRALEAAEVYTLGKTMWCLLQQVSGDDMADSARGLKPGEKIREIWWDDAASDIPDAWKDVIERCLRTDPNQRINLDELVEFWAGAEGEQR